jgi:hypothetical protein
MQDTTSFIRSQDVMSIYNAVVKQGELKLPKDSIRADAAARFGFQIHFNYQSRTLTSCRY